MRGIRIRISEIESRKANDSAMEPTSQHITDRFELFVSV